MPCREHLAQLRKQRHDFAALGAQIFAVTFEPPGEAMARFVRALGLPFPVLSDPDRAGYIAFGFNRGAPQQVWSWQTAGAYLHGMVRGQLPTRPHGDLEQLGGDVVLDAAGHIAFLYRGQTPADRPSVASLLDVMRATIDTAPPSP